MATAKLDPLIESRERFVSFVRSRLDDAELAEDIVQASLLKAVKAVDTLTDEEKLVPWFYTILRNAITDAYRQRAGRPQLDDIDLIADLEAPSPEDEQVLCECFRPLIPDLPPQYAEVIRRLDLEQQPGELALKELQITPTNLKVRHHRARKALKRKLEETCRTCAEHHCLDCTCRADRKPV